MAYRFEDPKDPDAVLDYSFDWATNWLSDEETIDSYTITPDDGITVDSDSQAGGEVTVWLSGGTDGVSYTVSCEIVTNKGRTDEKSFILPVAESDSYEE